jgi:hypothetical protein
MPVLEEIPQAARDRIGEIGTADLVIGLVMPGSPEGLDHAIAHARQAIGDLYTQNRSVVVYSGSVSLPDDAPEDDHLRTIAVPLYSPDSALDWADSIRSACDKILAIAINLGARAVAMIVSELELVTPQWIHQLVRPVLELDFDLVTPCYSHGRFEGLLNGAIVAPLTRALYGRRIQHPLGPDFGFSSRLAKHITEHPSARERASLASLSVDAICHGFEVCQANLGIRHYPAVDWTNQSSVLVQILDPVFREIEHRAPFWQRVRGSQTASLFGEPAGSPPASATLDARRLFESFQLGWRNLQELWSAVLPPGRMLELNRLARAPLDKFHMPDALWAHIVYDFAIGYHVRILNADHLLRAMTPLFLGWIASYALEPEPNSVDARLEELSLAFENAKPYALSRWRWPDRFIP